MNTINNNTNLVESFDSRYGEGSENVDFSFAFNDSRFSDRIIHLEIMNDLVEVQSNVETSFTSVDQTSSNKRKKENIKEGNGDEAGNTDDTANFSMDNSAVVKVKTLHVNSSILAAKSSFFYKLFSNGMRESKQTHITLKIIASEEAPFVQLLKFMYSSSLNMTSPSCLLDVLMAADKFGVASCMKYCIRVLLNIPMTSEYAMLYLELPYSVLMTKVVWPLAVAAKNYLVSRYKDVKKHQEELMGFPLVGVVTLLSSDELQVASEDVVYDFVLKWAQSQYPRLEERREILREKLIPLIRFPYMTCRKLKMVQSCNDLEHEVTSKLVFDALYFKAGAPHQKRILAAESTSTSRFFIERSYKYRPIKVVEFELPHQECVVYLDLRRDECTNLFPSGHIYSRVFCLGDQGFFLSAHCNIDQESFYHCFGLSFGMRENNSANFGVDYEFAVRSMPTLEYISKYKGNFIFTGKRAAIGYRNFFSTPWTSFIAEDNLFFINDILHLRVKLTIRS